MKSEPSSLGGLIYGRRRHREAKLKCSERRFHRQARLWLGRERR